MSARPILSRYWPHTTGSFDRAPLNFLACALWSGGSVASGPSGAKSTRRNSGRFSLATLNLVTGHGSLRSLPVFPSIARPRRSKSIFRCSMSMAHPSRCLCGDLGA